MVGSLSANVSGALVITVVQAAIALHLGIVYQIIIDICDIVVFLYCSKMCLFPLILGFSHVLLCTFSSNISPQFYGVIIDK